MVWVVFITGVYAGEICVCGWVNIVVLFGLGWCV